MRYMKEAEIEAFLEEAKKFHTRKIPDSRPYIISYLMVNTGMRVSEVVGEHYDYYLDDDGKRVSPRPTKKQVDKYGYIHKKNTISGVRIEDIDTEAHTIQIFGAKGKKDRLIPVTQECILLLGGYLSEDGRDWSALGQIFDCSVDRVQHWCRKISQTAGIRHVTPHMLRHSFSVRFLNAGGKIRVLQKILGHSSLSVTETYLDYVFEDVERDYLKVMGKIDERNVAED